ncbi:MAG: hypothetical protein KGR98_14330, partial [Verrucomicrobia bacterium]|nr:hypothetical protein [Verrucomicrobiota bacterium]
MKLQIETPEKRIFRHARRHALKAAAGAGLHGAFARCRLPGALSGVLGAALFGFGLALPAAPMASPNLDQPGQPFTWAAYPTDEIGLADALAGTEI